MLVALQRQVADRLVDIQVVDVDGDPALVALYDERVPVLMARNANGEELELCHYFLDAQRLDDFLGAQAVDAGRDQ